MRCRNRSVVRTGLLALYYTTILLALLGMYSLGAVAPSSFVYQGF